MAFGIKKISKVASDVSAAAKKAKAIAKRKAIAKNVAAKKKRDAAGMAKAKKLAQTGMTEAKKKPKPKTAIVQTPKGFVRKKLQKHPKAAAAGGGKKPPNGNGKKAGAAAPKKTPKKKGPFSDAVMKRAAAKQKQIWSYYSDEPIPKDVLKDMAKPKAKKSGAKVKPPKKKKAVDNRNKRNDILRRILNATDQDVINRLVKQLKKLT